MERLYIKLTISLMLLSFSVLSQVDVRIENFEINGTDMTESTIATNTLKLNAVADIHLTENGVIQQSDGHCFNHDVHESNVENGQVYWWAEAGLVKSFSGCFNLENLGLRFEMDYFEENGLGVGCENDRCVFGCRDAYRCVQTFDINLSDTINIQNTTLGQPIHYEFFCGINWGIRFDVIVEVNSPSNLNVGRASSQVYIDSTLNTAQSLFCAEQDTIILSTDPFDPGKWDAANTTYKWEVSTDAGVTWTSASPNTTDPEIRLVPPIPPVGDSLKLDYRVFFEEPGCARSFEARFAQITVHSPPPNGATYLTEDILCFGANDGRIAVTSVTGGFGPYNYYIRELSGPIPVPLLTGNPNPPNGVFEGLYPGDHMVVVENANGICRYIVDTIRIEEPPLLFVDTYSSTDVNCKDENDGTITINALGGVPPYEYVVALYADSSQITISPTNTITGLVAGQYAIFVKDANGCNSTQKLVTINEPIDYVTSTNSITDVSCSGGNDGSLNIDAYGGTAPYQYSIDGGTTYISGTDPYNFNGLVAGTYYLGVQDANGCVFLDTVDVMEPTSIIPQVLSITDVTCNSTSDGTISAGATGGTTPYQYSLDNINYQGSPNFSGIGTGVQTLYVQDGNGCVESLPFTMNEPPLLVLGTNFINDVSCFGSSDGSFELVSTGGTPPYEFSIDGGTFFQSSSLYDPLSVNTYNCVVRDANGCTASLPVTISQPALVDAGSFTTTGVSCYGATDGNLNSTPTGGTPPYQYSLDPTNGYQTASTFNGLAAGTYNIHIIDSNGCTGVSSFSITSPNIFEVSISSLSNITCFGANDGNAVVGITGGTAPFSYSIDGGATNQASNSFTGLIAGTYTVDVTDNNGCTQSINFTITEPTQLVMNATSPNMVNCSNDNGEINITVTGGEPFYQYSIDNGVNYQNTPSFDNLSAGTYNVVVLDNNGCTVSQSLTLNQIPNSLVLSTISINDVSCNGGTDGSVTLEGTGGSGDYRYRLSTASSFVTNPTFGGLPVGIHTFELRDNVTGCVTTTTATISEPTIVSIGTVSTIDETCYLASDGEVTISANGGIPPYTYTWNNSITQSSPTFTGLPSGANLFGATDANGCSVTTVVNINSASSMFVTYSTTNVSCNGLSDGGISTSISGGTAPFTYTWNGTLGSSSIGGVSAGTYNLVIQDANGCGYSENITLYEPPSINAMIINLNPVDCNGGADGSFDVQVSGGLPPFTYSIDGGVTSQASNSFSGLPPSTYIVLVMDANGCTTSVSANISAPGSIGLNLEEVVDVSCNGGMDGVIEVQGTGGSLPYTYSIDGINFSALNIFSNLTQGTYTLSVEDANGCGTSITATVNEPTILSSSTTIIRDASCGQYNGEASVSVTGGTPPYTYLWDNLPVQNSDVLTNALAGVHTVVITDANGCTISDMATIADLAGPTASIISVINSACSQSIGEVTIGASGGIPPYTYEWAHDGSITSNSATGLSSGSYIISVTDSDGCEDIITANVSDINGPTVTLVSSVSSACDLPIGEISINVTGGTAPYTYLWDDPALSTTPNISGLYEGNYNVEVIDVDGCIGTLSVNIDDVPDIDASVSSLSHPSCVGSTDGSISVSHIGGTAPFSYLWDDPSTQTTSTASGLGAGIYTVVVTDANNCTFTLQDSLAETPLLVETGNIVQASCTGGSDAVGEVVVSGGAPPYSYVWPTGGTTSAESGLVAGVYIVTITDANSCTEVHDVVIDITEPYEVYLSESGDTTLCLGQSLDIDLGNPNYTYTWGGTAAFFNDGSLANMTEEGTYWVTATNSFGCTSTDTINITYSSDVLQANFLLPTETVVGDTVVAVEVSWPMPETVTWFYDTDSVTYVSSNLNSETLIFPYEGVYTIGMESTLGSCVDYVEKQIFVYADPDNFGNPNNGLGAEILAFNIFPNPNDGDFTVSLSLSSVMDVQLRIYHENGSPVDSRLLSGNDTYQEEYSLQGLSTGIHTILIQTQNSWRSFSFAVTE